MISYKDRAYCSRECGNNECSRNFNDDVMAHARAWWGSDGEPPIDFADMRTDECGFVRIEESGSFVCDDMTIYEDGNFNMNIKYTSDGKKVSVLGKLNAQESIVQEIFVTQDGAEIPSGENFVVKSLHDTPAVSWQEKELKKLENLYKTESNEWKRRINSLLDSVNKEYSILEALLNNARSTIKSWDHDCFNRLELFLTGKIKYLVLVEYCNYKIFEFSEAISDIDNNIRLITLFGRSDGSLDWKINHYRDGSGNDTTIIPATSLEEAKALLEVIIAKKIDEKNTANDAMVEAKKLYGLSVPSEDQISQLNLKTIEQKNKIIEKLKSDILTVESEIEAISSGNDEKAAK